MSLTGVLIGLLAWLATSLIIAYLFGRLVEGMELPVKSNRTPSVVEWYLQSTRGGTRLRWRSPPIIGWAGLTSGDSAADASYSFGARQAEKSSKAP